MPLAQPATRGAGEDREGAGSRSARAVRELSAAVTSCSVVVFGATGTAGSELVHGFDSWDWDQLTFRAVAAQAGVGERTVYRHFPTERLLHDAVMHRLHEEAGVDYGSVTIDNLAEVKPTASTSAHGASRFKLLRDRLSARQGSVHLGQRRPLGDRGAGAGLRAVIGE